MKTLKDYITENGKITNSRLFQGERLYVPYFWDFALKGLADETYSEGIYVFDVTMADIKEFPELGTIDLVVLYQSDVGLILGSTWNRQDWRKEIKEHRRTEKIFVALEKEHYKKKQKKRKSGDRGKSLLNPERKKI